MTRALQIAQRCYTATNEAQLTRILCEVADHFQADGYGALRFGSTEHGVPTNALTTISAEEAVIDKRYPFSGDPVMQHLRLSSTPILWGEATYSAHGLKPLHGMLRDLGLHSGLSLALHLSPTQHFILGVSWEAQKNIPSTVVSDLQMLAIYAWPAFNRVWSDLEHDAPEEPLTDRECHCLYWVGRGMTDSEIGTLVGITRRTVERDVQSATYKLNASRRTEAALIADRLGYTHPFRLQFSGSRIKRLTG